MTVTSHLQSWTQEVDPFDYDVATVEKVQLAIANERFQEMRGKIDALDHIAMATDTTSIQSLSDLVPVLFSHESYKSYPEALVRQQKWQYLSAWLSRFTSETGLREVDMGGVDSVDGWIDRLRSAGFLVYGSSGTSGKSSLFAMSAADRSMAADLHAVDFAWGPRLTTGTDIRIFILMPRRGFYRGSEDTSTFAARLVSADAVTWMSDEPLLLSDINRMGEVRRAIAAGTARPSEIAALEGTAAERNKQVGRDLERLADQLEADRERPALIWGGWAQQFRLVQLLRGRGHGDGFLEPASVVHIAGGKKGVALPADFESTVRSFWGLDPSRYLLRYGCSEIVGLIPACSEARYHLGPWIIPLILDKSGQAVVSVGAGECDGRMAFMDLTSAGRWGGVITGDRVSFSSGPCPCGRRGSSVANISRYSDLDEGEDKLSCAGTIEAYVRGEISL